MKGRRRRRPPKEGRRHRRRGRRAALAHGRHTGSWSSAGARSPGEARRPRDHEMSERACARMTSVHASDERDVALLFPSCPPTQRSSASCGTPNATRARRAERSGDGQPSLVLVDPRGITVYRVLVDRQIPGCVGRYGMRDGVEAGIEVSRRPGINRSDECRAAALCRCRGRGWRVRRPDEAGQHGDACPRGSNPCRQGGTNESRVDQRGARSDELATQPKTTGDPDAPTDAAKFDSLLAKTASTPGLRS